MADSSTSIGDVEPSSTTAQPDSPVRSAQPSTSASVKREHEEDDDAPVDGPNKKQRLAFEAASNGTLQSSSKPKHGPMGQLLRGLDWAEGNEDLTDEVHEFARKLRALVCNPHETNFKGYKIDEEVEQSSSDAAVAKEEAEENISNPHTNVPPPFALPNKNNFVKGPVPAYNALNKAAPTISNLPPVPASKNHNTTTNVDKPASSVLPQLPQITNVALASAPFMHASLLPAYVAPTGTNSYEPLEFLGDAYLEVIATRLIHSRFPLHTVGQKAGLRELLVKNETLAEYSTAYGFGERVQSSHKERHGPVWTKVLGDVFEAYLACIIIQDEESDAGFLLAEQWLTELWAPKILEWRKAGDGLQDTSRNNSQTLDPKTDLNRLLTGKDAKVEYREEKEMQLIKDGNRTIFFMAVYLTGWGFQNQHLGSGEGRSKQIASTNAAEYALRNSQDIIQTAHQRKTYFEKQFKRGANRGRGGGGGGHQGRGGSRGGFAGLGHAGPAAGLPPRPGFPQGPPPQIGGYPPQQHMGYPQHPAPGSWNPSR